MGSGFYLSMSGGGASYGRFGEVLTGNQASIFCFPEVALEFANAYVHISYIYFAWSDDQAAASAFEIAMPYRPFELSPHFLKRAQTGTLHVFYSVLTLGRETWSPSSLCSLGTGIEPLEVNRVAPIRRAIVVQAPQIEIELSGYANVGAGNHVLLASPSNSIIILKAVTCFIVTPFRLMPCRSPFGFPSPLNYSSTIPSKPLQS